MLWREHNQRLAKQQRRPRSESLLLTCNLTLLIFIRQEAAVRKKRQERDAVLKKQADVAAKRRKREAEKAEKLSKKARKAEAEAKAEEANIDTEKAMPTPLISRSNIPDLLPEEYLQDDDEDSDELDGSETEVVRRNPKKMKFSELVEKKPKDRRKGSTTYRVSEVQSRILAPKPSFHAKATKESWLKGRAGKGPGGIRKVASTGFFKKK
jgi:U3 small nucleolar RNA-associated protein 16